MAHGIATTVIQNAVYRTSTSILYGVRYSRLTLISTGRLTVLEALFRYDNFTVRFFPKTATITDTVGILYFRYIHVRGVLMPHRNRYPPKKTCSAAFAIGMIIYQYYDFSY